LRQEIDGIEGKSIVEEQKLLAPIATAKVHIGEVHDSIKFSEFLSFETFSQRI
jgi:hypothetical protein